MGAILGVLFAPMSGKAAPEDILGKIEGGPDKATDKIQRLEIRQTREKSCRPCCGWRKGPSFRHRRSCSWHVAASAAPELPDSQFTIELLDDAVAFTGKGFEFLAVQYLYDSTSVLDCSLFL
jgi:hypothetical protein